jgi:hypothetical protein
VIKPKKLFLRGFLLRVPKVRFVVVSVHISDEDDMLMEDGMIYPWDGALDVGEQLFFLKMDPYPKKPGSDFTSFTITG